MIETAVLADNDDDVSLIGVVVLPSLLPLGAGAAAAANGAVALMIIAHSATLQKSLRRRAALSRRVRFVGSGCIRSSPFDCAENGTDATGGR